MFKITGGQFRGTHLLLPDESITRPTSTRAREALFNCLFSLEFQMNDAVIIDGFAGSGAIGLECLSRGAAHCTFIEHNNLIQKILKANIQKLKVDHQTTILNTFDMIKHKADFIFLDPPYFAQENGAPLYIKALHSLKHTFKEETLLVIETDEKEIPDVPELSLIYSKVYGTVRLSFYRL